MSRPGRPTIPAVLGLLALAIAVPASADAQGVRGWVGSTVQAVELRPLALDTVPTAEVEEVDGRFFFQGRQVVCGAGGACVRYVPAAEQTSVSATQDLTLTAWGFGVEGLSVTTWLRGRSRMGSDLVWPRSDDEVDVLLGYGQWVRDAWRVRVGRQEIRSGLGFPAFDGGSLAVTLGGVRLEGYGGRSLARGLREPARDILRGLEDFVPDESVWLLGGSVRGRLAGVDVTGRYQREVLADRSGLESERASLDFTSTLPGVRVRGALDYDLAFERVGKSHLTLALPLEGGRWMVEATARRYVPYFSLSTIWGYFDPVAYDEATVRVGWSPGTVLGAWVTGGYRSYGDTETVVILEPLTDDGWRADAGIRWAPAPRWSVQGDYELEWGPGGFLSAGDVALRWTPSEEASVGLTGTTFQKIEQFRLGDGRAWGGGVDARVGLGDRTDLSGGFMIMRQETRDGAVDAPWNQSRGWAALRVRVGDDPGLAARREP